MHLLRINDMTTFTKNNVYKIQNLNLEEYRTKLIELLQFKVFNSESFKSNTEQSDVLYYFADMIDIIYELIKTYDGNKQMILNEILNIKFQRGSYVQKEIIKN